MSLIPVVGIKKILNYTIAHRIIVIMKVTALIPDNLIEEVKEYAKGKNTTESLIKALSEWLKMQKIKKLKAMRKTALKKSFIGWKKYLVICRF